MANIRPVVFYVTAGAVGGMLGTFLVNKTEPFWAWSIAGLVMACMIFASNEKLRKHIALGGVAVITIAAVIGGLAALIYTM